eukprot:TRINITY_DN51304_c0_g1_i1.p1 TRINITY_DN51304_c0_g1~~TRINITY_DN51304_c0_g1_i1.p1  ORF type:complete len:590 (+),score=177.09 TRINITY_DN51304_c0_g1_i1:73-1770(+)
MQQGTPASTLAPTSPTFGVGKRGSNASIAGLEITVPLADVGFPVGKRSPPRGVEERSPLSRTSLGSAGRPDELAECKRVDSIDVSRGAGGSPPVTPKRGHELAAPPGPTGRAPLPQSRMPRRRQLGGRSLSTSRNNVTTGGVGAALTPESTMRSVVSPQLAAQGSSGSFSLLLGSTQLRRADTRLSVSALGCSTANLDATAGARKMMRDLRRDATRSILQRQRSRAASPKDPRSAAELAADVARLEAELQRREEELLEAAEVGQSLVQELDAVRAALVQAEEGEAAALDEFEALQEEHEHLQQQCMDAHRELTELRACNQEAQGEVSRMAEDVSQERMQQEEAREQSMLNEMFETAELWRRMRYAEGEAWEAVFARFAAEEGCARAAVEAAAAAGAAAIISCPPEPLPPPPTPPQPPPPLHKESERAEGEARRAAEDAESAGRGALLHAAHALAASGWRDASAAPGGPQLDEALQRRLAAAVYASGKSNRRNVCAALARARVAVERLQLAFVEDSTGCGGAAADCGEVTSDAPAPAPLPQPIANVAVNYLHLPISAGQSDSDDSL